MTSPRRPPAPRISSPGDALAWVSGLLLALSSFTSWYSIGFGAFVNDAPVELSVTGWHSGAFGKLVFFSGIAVLLLLLLGSTGLELPPAFPTGAAVAALGALGTIFVLIRVIEIPESLELPGTGRSVGIWISLAAGVAVVASGLLKASEEV